VEKVQKIDKIRKLVFLDFSLALKGNISVINREKNEDFVYFESSHSVHRRFQPYIVYMLKDGHLYRLESLQQIASYELASDAAFDIEDLGEVKSFRVYKTTKKTQSYFVAIDFVKMDDLLLKINPLNEY
jgi:hypothetical protein